mmetsp:Transcript_54640/g.166045  ORF Transcript_54640/g.166045 Transcript_54640/m.166045 type:complete len:209 (+) Transcript_54640:900-1526(+)
MHPWTISTLMPKEAKDDTSGTLFSYSSMKDWSGHSKAGNTTLTTLVSLICAVHTSPTHQGRMKISLVQTTTKVSVSDRTKSNNVDKSRRSSESTNTFFLTCVACWKTTFKRRAKLPAPNLWWQMKYPNGLPLRRNRRNMAYTMPPITPKSPSPSNTTQTVAIDPASTCESSTKRANTMRSMHNIIEARMSMQFAIYKDNGIVLTVTAR